MKTSCAIDDTPATPEIDGDRVGHDAIGWRRRGRPGVLLVALSLVLAGTARAETVREAGVPGVDRIKSIAVAPPPDPSEVASHGYCYYNYRWNGTRARVYHPSNGGCSASVYSPLVIVLHAAGNTPNYGHADYDYLQRHLARNGFISASIDVEADSASAVDQQQAADEAWAFVEDFLFFKWSKRFYIDPSSVAVIGHSRGGATARYLAHKLADDDLFDVRSVVSLAPVGPENDYLTGMETIGYLSLYGTSDFDVSPRGVYKHFDMAGDNDSQLDPVWYDTVLYKAMKLVGGATHIGFSDLGSAEQRKLTRGYVLAFLKAHNANDVAWYENYIRGDDIPGGWDDLVWTQYSDGFYRRVIDNFDDGVAANNTLGGALTTYFADADVLDLGDYPTTNVHTTHALWTWGSIDGAAVTWSIPPGKRNAVAFEWLSLRIGQTSGAPAEDLRIQLRNGAAWSPELRLTDFGELAQPVDMCFIQLGDPCSEFEHMATIRIPLSAFGAHDDVQYVRIRFRGDAIPKTFIVDNLEFSEWILKP